MYHLSVSVADHFCVCKMAAVNVCVVSSSLSLLTGKARAQWLIEDYQRVSDECSSGVVRVVHEAHSIPGVCSLCAVDS